MNSSTKLMVSALALSGLSLALSTQAVFATTYSVDNAISDSYHGADHNHALWLPGLESDIGTDFIFTDDTGLGTFTENADGTASLRGMVISETHSDRGWNIDINLNGRSDIALDPSPKKELKSSAYTQNSGPVDTSTWHYYGSDDSGNSTFMGNFLGVLEGTGAYEGATLGLSGFGANFQVGEGANGKNIKFGGSGWFTWNVMKNESGISLNNSPKHGDFNLYFGDDPGTTQTPEPSTLVLLGSGLAGLAWWRKQKAAQA